MTAKNFLRQILSLILPITTIIVVPLVIESNFFITFDILSFIGIVFLLSGFILLCITITMFIRIGRGTLAPWSPTSKLVVGGIYAHVRNPMITGVMTILLGESMIFHSLNIFIWLIVFFMINNIYFVLSEEPGLVKRFGKDYLEYKKNVPRWIPRLNAWNTKEIKANERNS